MSEGIYTWTVGRRVIVEAVRSLTAHEISIGLVQSYSARVSEVFADGCCRVDGWLVNRYGAMAAAGSLPPMHVRHKEVHDGGERA